MDNKETLYSGKFLKIVKVNEWEFVERINCTGVVAIIPVTKDKKFIFVEQYRIPIASNVIEFPAGLVNDKEVQDESFETAAFRELLEETGYQAEKLTYITKGPNSAGLTSEVASFFLAEDLTKISSGGGVENESIIIHEVPIKDVDNWLEEMKNKGKMVSPKIYAGIYLAKRKYNLF